MNNKLEVIGIDHGWSMMKTISQVFVTGVTVCVNNDENFNMYETLNKATGGIFVSWRRKEKLPTGA